MKKDSLSGSSQEERALSALAEAQNIVRAAEFAAHFSGETMKEIATLSIARLAECAAVEELARVRLTLAMAKP